MSNPGPRSSSSTTAAGSAMSDWPFGDDAEVSVHQPTGEVRYRYWDSPWGDGDPTLETYEVVSKTGCGVWIETAGDQKRFVLDGARKRFAYPTIAEARASYLIRKKKAVVHCENALQKQLAMLEKAWALVKESSK